MIISFDGIYYDCNKSNAIKLNYKMYDDFCKCCKQEHYSYELISETSEYVICHADNHAIEFFIGCMKSEHKEIIKMLCSLSKSTLADRLDGLHFEEESEKWIDNVDINLVKEALYRYDEHEFVEERAKMMKTL